MRASRFLLALLSTVALTGCDRNDGGSAPVAGGANGLVDETSGDEAEAIGADETEPEPLVVEWTDGAEAAAVSSVSFVVENATANSEHVAEVKLVATGALGTAERSFGEVALGPGESESFTLDASEMPVRSDAVVGQMFVVVARQVATTQGTRAAGHVTAMRFYRHEVGYSELRAYTENTLKSDLDGELFDVASSVSEVTEGSLAAEQLGEIAVGDEAEAVTIATSGLAVRDGDGDLIALVTRSALRAGDPGVDGMIVSPEDDEAPSADGMEADHE